LAELSQICLSKSDSYLVSGRMFLWQNSVEAAVKDEVTIRSTGFAQLDGEIRYFDVDASENILLGFRNVKDETEYIYVFNQEMIFQYGYAVNTSGGIDVRLCNNGILVYVIRNKEVLVLNKLGEIIEVKNPENVLVHDKRWDWVKPNTPIFAGGKKYYYENKRNQTDVYYSKAAFTQHNEEVILY
jgi:hypothetical protein